MALLLAICGSCFLLYCCFVLFSFWFFAREKPLSQSPFIEPPLISVLVAARNEEEGILACLVSILNQDYPAKYEVILIDDHSEDKTAELAAGLAQKYPQLRIYTNKGKGKKAAISYGVSLASAEIIFQTDADCQVSPSWLSSMYRYFEKDTAFVSGPLALEYKGSFFQAMQALESMGLVAFGAGFLLGGKPNMANGANMAYRKSVFMELGGFEGVDHIASGDDELLLQKIKMSGKYKLAFCKKYTAIVRTKASQSWQEFKAQRIRWVSKARAYLDRFPNFVQAISYVGFLLFPLLLIASFWNPQYLLLALGAFLLKLIIDMALMYQAARFFHNLRILRWFLPLQILYIPYVLWIGMKALSVRNYSWKGRNVS